MSERRNSYPGKCGICGTRVGAREGLLTGSRAAGWGVKCLTACEVPVVDDRPVYGPERPELTRGVYVTASGRLVRVRISQRTDKAYGLTWAPTGPTSGEWTYHGRAILAEIVRPINADEASRFGHDAGECVYCSRPLDDARSVAMGYGPTCAKNYGLPWGEARQARTVVLAS